jgi:hypothetical protein
MPPTQPAFQIPNGKGYDAHHYLYDRRPEYRGSLYPVVSRPSLYNNNSPFTASTPLLRLDEGPQTVEQVIEQGYFAVPPLDSEMAMIDDRKHTSWLGLDDVIRQIKDRRQIYERNILEIEWGKCYAFNELARGGWPPSEDQIITYQKSLQKLHSEQRLERVSLWQDIFKARQLLPESAQQYLSAFRKSEILNEPEGDDL